MRRWQSWALGAWLVLAGCDRELPPPPPPPPDFQPIPPAPTAADGDSSYGTIRLATGFDPDPHVSTGASGGAVNAGHFGHECSGWVSEKPDHIFVLSETFPLLRILIHSGVTDTTLVVQRPDGVFLCNDDGRDRNPVLQGTFMAGTYKLWVGSYEQGVTSAYSLGFSQRVTTTAQALPVPPGGAPVEAQPHRTSNYGTLEMRPGFEPDPLRTPGAAGGTVPAASIDPSCGGFLSLIPDHLFLVEEGFDALRIVASAEEDVGLLVQRPDGTFVCSEGSGENKVEPAVTLETPEKGRYRVWVTSTAPEHNSDYMLGVGTNVGLTSEEVAPHGRGPGAPSLRHP